MWLWLSTFCKCRTDWLSTIRARLYLAFGFAAALTIIGSSIAFNEFVTIGATTNDIALHSLPEIVALLRIVEDAGGLLASAPRLIASSDDKTRAQIEWGIEQQEKNVKQDIARLRVLSISGADDIDAKREGLFQRFGALNRAVADRIAISNKRYDLALSVRTTHKALLDALAPVIESAHSNLMARKQAEIDVKRNADSEIMRRLFEVESESNRLAGLLTDASLVDDLGRIEVLRGPIAFAKRKIEGDLSEIDKVMPQRELVKLYDKLANIGSDNGMIDLRAVELGRQHDAQLAFAVAQSETFALKNVVEALAQQQSQAALENVLRVDQQIRAAQALLVALSIAATIGGILVAWLYIGRNVVRRLGVLSEAMRRITAGDIEVRIHDNRGDEIADMAGAVVCFRQAIADAAAAKEKDSEQARALESRRHLVERATDCFERAVSSVVQTLDHAAAAMDSSAQSMAEIAGFNQRLALSTASASEQATDNVEIVANAAEEMARSNEDITAIVLGAAAVARQAVGEAKEITDAVENLSTSVAEIGQFSDLIGEIAGQTNLLALNATIEAARARDAGRGFAVVAEEVKSLAVQTGKAAEKITQQILSIKETTSRSVRAMKTIGATIMQVDNLASEVAGRVRHQGFLTQGIARSAGAAAKGTRDVSANIGEVSNTAVKTGRVAKTVIAAAEELTDQSRLLRQEVEHYLHQVQVI
jgi:methyl-accepting chemotaxis protein